MYIPAHPHHIAMQQAVLWLCRYASIYTYLCMSPEIVLSKKKRMDLLSSSLIVKMVAQETGNANYSPTHSKGF